MSASRQPHILDDDEHKAMHYIQSLVAGSSSITRIADMFGISHDHASCVFGLATSAKLSLDWSHLHCPRGEGHAPVPPGDLVPGLDVRSPWTTICSSCHMPWGEQGTIYSIWNRDILKESR